jgi:ubiquinone/menaquinone biosynthesis C-methylase UbiE
VGLYGDQILPRVMNAICGTKSSDVLRERTCAQLTGRVVEIGFGSGLNVKHYPSAVVHVDAVEPSDVAWRLAASRLTSSQTPVQRSARDAQQLPYGDHVFDSAVSTWTMCTIPDLERALGEIRRVLKPHGTLHFIEHGLAPDENVQRWQRRLEPLQKRMAGGCHLTRDIADVLTSAGFEFKEKESFYEEGAPKVLAADTIGIAVPL